MKKLAALLLFVSVAVSAQNTSYWQQHADYTMDIDVDVTKYQYKGKQTLIYTNNSPDELNNVYYHLYYTLFNSYTTICISTLFNQVHKWMFDLEISKIQMEEFAIELAN